MSFGNTRLLSGVQEALMLALMLVTVLGLFYVEMDFTYKIAIALFSFSVIILGNLAAAMLKQQKELREKQMKQA
ncbi:MAG: hypothetical protein ACQCN4_12840 [Candidatus Bathyarchaeia archaeon]|jgi:hypothetical protein